MQIKAGARRLAQCGVLLAAAASLAGGAPAETGGRNIRISQRDQAFRPGEISIMRGSTVDIVNDDNDLLHHAYIDSSTFKFDSGDQDPGRTVAVTFPVAGKFTVLCGIHPRMKLVVHVE